MGRIVGLTFSGAAEDTRRAGDAKTVKKETPAPKVVSSGAPRKKRTKKGE